MTTDLAVDLGLKLPPLTPATNRRMQEIYGAQRPFTNPFDVGSYPLMARGDNMTRTLTTLIDDPSVDFIACAMVVQRDLKGNRMQLFDQIRNVVPGSPKPFVLLPEATAHWRDTPPDIGAHLCASLPDGLFGMRALIEYAKFRRRPSGHANAMTAPFVLRAAPGRTVMTEFESKQVLAQAGLPVTREALTQNVDAASREAIQIGYPVALKIQSPDLMHKTEVGGLALNIADEAALRRAWTHLEGVADRANIKRLDGMLVQEMATPGTEFLIGMKRDPVFGPVVVVSAGGVFVDLLGKDARLRLPPFDLRDVEAMLATSPVMLTLLSEFRGKPPADRAAFARLVCDFGDFVTRLDDTVLAIDLNPVIVSAAGKGVRIVDASIEFASA